MGETIIKPEGKDWKKLLKSQVYTMSEKIWKVLSRYDDDDDEVKEWDKKKPRSENDVIKDILEERSDLFARRAIVGDIISYSTKVLWEEKQITKFKCKYWLSITIDNLNSFLDFCAIHGFIPMVDKIFIWQKDVSKIKELYTFFAFAITKPSNPLIINSLGNEIKKLEKESQWPSRDVLDYLQRIIDHNTKTYQHLLWERLQKLTNKWALSENIFAEVAIRLENQIREKVKIASSYLKLAWYKDDMENKTDMDFIIRKTLKQSYQVIPMQFTTSWLVWVKNKEKSVENYIFKSLNEKKKIWSFLILAVNGEFSNHIAHWDTLDKENGEDNEEYMVLNQEYSNWIENPEEREKNVGSKFPLFIDSIDPKIIQPAEIMYIALHMLYKKYNFRYTMKDSYKNSFKKSGKIDKTNHSDINNIKLSDIEIAEYAKNESLKIDGCSIEKIENPRPGFPLLLKHRFSISYQWEHMWIIVIYEVEQNKNKR